MIAEIREGDTAPCDFKNTKPGSIFHCPVFYCELLNFDLRPSHVFSNPRLQITFRTRASSNFFTKKFTSFCPAMIGSLDVHATSRMIRHHYPPAACFDMLWR